MSEVMQSAEAQRPRLNPRRIAAMSTITSSHMDAAATRRLEEQRITHTVNTLYYHATSIMPSILRVLWSCWHALEDSDVEGVPTGNPCPLTSIALNTTVRCGNACHAQWRIDDVIGRTIYTLILLEEDGALSLKTYQTRKAELLSRQAGAVEQKASMAFREIEAKERLLAARECVEACESVDMSGRHPHFLVESTMPSSFGSSKLDPRTLDDHKYRQIVELHAQYFIKPDPEKELYLPQNLNFSKVPGALFELLRRIRESPCTQCWKNRQHCRQSEGRTWKCFECEVEGVTCSWEEANPMFIAIRGDVTPVAMAPSLPTGAMEGMRASGQLTRLQRWVELHLLERQAIAAEKEAAAAQLKADAAEHEALALEDEAQVLESMVASHTCT
ncbi:hypothetical protein LXA43DRAFT_1063373 [Ganoderma leucocontextum]|nr:hypothetical protein LXA43DRAFT_1063373 [Ganoderma leucocontextum]